MSSTPCGCPEYTRLSRRGLLRGAALAGTAYAVGSAVVTVGASPAMAEPGAGTDPVVVVLSLRGAADGLSLVVPHGDPAYYAARPGIGIAADQLLARDDFFGLHPDLAPLVPMWQQGRMAAVHATGLAVANRSHFAAMEEVEDADPGGTVRVGWLNRMIGADADPDPLQGIAVGSTMTPTSLFGPADTMSFDTIDDAVIAGDDQWDPDHRRVQAINAVWAADPSPMGHALRSAVAATGRLAPARALPDTRGAYPGGDLGRALSSVSRTIRADVGARAITVDQGEWDMHSDLGTLAWGRMKSNTAELAGCLAAFFDDLGPHASRVTVVTISEFGRRVVENASYGLDHGWGNVMFLLGAGVKGGYFGRWAGLGTDLDSDLTVTTDYRSVLAEVVRTRSSASVATVFPGFTPEDVGAMTSL